MTTITGSGGGGKGGGGGARPPQEAPNTLRSKAYVRFVDLLTVGPIIGLPEGGKSIFFDETPLLAADGAPNFRGVQWALTAGLPDQAALPGLDSAQNEVAVNAQVTVANGPVVRTIAAGPINAARVTIRIPALMQQDASTGDINPTSVSFAIDVRTNTGSWQTAVDETINGKCTSPYERSYRISLPSGGAPWHIRVRRITPDSTTTTLRNDLIWASYTEIGEWLLYYPDMAVIGMAVDSELFGGRIPSRRYVGYWRRVKVPVNYDPWARTYSGAWNGQFKLDWTNNPAWVWYDLATDPLIGAGSFLPASQIDKWALYEIAQYCDEWVPDGKGGYEPRYTWNGQIVSREPAMQLLQRVAASFNAQVYFGAGMVTLVQDKPQAPVKLVTNANVIGGRFEYSGSGVSARHTICHVAFNDPDAGYRPSIEIVEDAEGVARFGPRVAEIEALGCTSRGQARRMGRWLLDTEKHSTEVVTYRAALDHADVRPGDIIAVADATYSGLRRGGRIASATTAAVTLDAPVTLVAGPTYTLHVTLPNGTLEARTVTNGAGTHTTLTVNPAFSVAPAANAIWLLSGTDVAPRQFRVLSNTEVEPTVYEIVALVHDPTKYARIEHGLNVAAPPVVGFPTGPLAAPTDITIDERFVVSGSAARARVLVSWRHSRDPRVQTYQAEWMAPGTAFWQPIGETSTNSISFEHASEGLARFRVRAVDGINNLSPWTTSQDFELLGLRAPPDDVTGFTGYLFGSLLRLTWEPVSQHAIVYYTIRWTPDLVGASWEASVVVAPRVDGTMVDVPARDGTYMIRAVTDRGGKSTTPAAWTTQVNTIEQMNAVVTLAEQPAWSGAKVNLVTSGAFLMLAPAATSGTYTFASPDLGDVYVSRLTAVIRGAGVGASDIMASWITLADVTALWSGERSNWTANLFVRTTNDNPAGTPQWSAWQPFIAADFSARAYQFRLDLASTDGGQTRPELSALEVTIDMPDRVEGARNVSVPASGTRISFAHAFHAVPAIVVTGQNLATGDYVSVWNQTRDGFDVRFFNAAGIGIARVMDWVARGYGRSVA